MRAKLPNALSLSRVVLALLLIPLAYRLEVHRYVLTLILVAVALTTDGLDGYLARRWNARTELGYVLDALGDRALHLALILVMLVRYEFHPVFAWLLIFRDICIYAIRVLSKEWHTRSLELRWISVTHATLLRLWLCLFLVRDGFRVFARSDVLDVPLFAATQLTILCATLALSYYGLFLSFRWLRDREHESI